MIEGNSQWEIHILCDAAHRSGQAFFRVHVFPFRMTGENLTDHRDHEWRDFWLDLREGHDGFEKYGVPSDVSVSSEGKYTSNIPKKVTIPS